MELVHTQRLIAIFYYTLLPVSVILQLSKMIFHMCKKVFVYKYIVHIGVLFVMV